MATCSMARHPAAGMEQHAAADFVPVRSQTPSRRYAARVSFTVVVALFRAYDTMISTPLDRASSEGLYPELR